MLKIISILISGSFITLELKGQVKCIALWNTVLSAKNVKMMNGVHSAYCRNNKNSMLQNSIPNIVIHS